MHVYIECECKGCSGHYCGWAVCKCVCVFVVLLFCALSGELVSQAKAAEFPLLVW